MTNNEAMLLPDNCPFCGSKPFVEQGKRGSCQLHGEPFQSVVIRCKKQECPAKPLIQAGDIFNGGYEKAKAEAVAIWNTRPENSLIEENRKLRDALEKIKNEAITLYRQDNAEFMRLGRDEVQKWDAPSRHLQTFSWLKSFCKQALSAKGVA
jgi:hypothetical protein